MERSDCRSRWSSLKDFRYCDEHKQKFDYINPCPFFKKMSSFSKKRDVSANAQAQNNLQYVVKNVSSASQKGVSSAKTISKSKKEVSKRFHSKSQSIHSSSRRVSVTERFHSYRVRYDAIVDWDLIKGEPVNLRNNVSYKRLDYPFIIVQVFRRSVLLILRASAEINRLYVREAEVKANGLFMDVIALLPKSIVITDSKVISLHNAFVNHPTSRLFKDSFGHDMNVKGIDGITHLITDTSHGFNELEYVNPKTAVLMSEYREAYEADIIFNNPELPSIQDKKIIELTNILHGFALEFERHSVVQQAQLDNMKEMNKMLKKINMYLLTIKWQRKNKRFK